MSIYKLYLGAQAEMPILKKKLKIKKYKSLHLHGYILKRFKIKHLYFKVKVPNDKA